MAASATDSCRRTGFTHLVFVLPPWREIYVTDEERDQPFDGADAIHRLTLDWYGKAGYSIALVPLASARERAQFVLRALGLD